MMIGIVGIMAIVMMIIMGIIVIVIRLIIHVGTIRIGETGGGGWSTGHGGIRTRSLEPQNMSI
jgi:hypothetical protein